MSHGHQGLQPAGCFGIEARCRPRDQRVLRLVQGRPDDLGDAIRARRLDELHTAPGQQLVANPVLPTLGLGRVGGEPEGQLLGIGHAALAKARVAPDLTAVALARPPGHVVGLELGPGHTHLAGDVVDGVVGQLVALPWETDHARAGTSGSGRSRAEALPPVWEVAPSRRPRG